jgi:hypothetical protein
MVPKWQCSPWSWVAHTPTGKDSRRPAFPRLDNCGKRPVQKHDQQFAAADLKNENSFRVAIGDWPMARCGKT